MQLSSIFSSNIWSKCRQSRAVLRSNDLRGPSKCGIGENRDDNNHRRAVAAVAPLWRAKSALSPRRSLRRSLGWRVEKAEDRRDRKEVSRLLTTDHRLLANIAIRETVNHTIMQLSSTFSSNIWSKCRQSGGHLRINDLRGLSKWGPSTQRRKDAKF